MVTAPIRLYIQNASGMPMIVNCTRYAVTIHKSVLGKSETVFDNGGNDMIGHAYSGRATGGL